MELEKEILTEEGLDLRFFFLRLFNSIWMILVAALAGAAICAGGYQLYKQINPDAKEYRAETKYYIDFAEDSTGIGYGYYNDYTWNDFMKSDAVLNYTMSLLPEEISKETVEKAVVADIISDVRLLTITVTTSEAETADKIAEATAKSLAHYPEEIKEIDAIRVIREEKAEEILVGDSTKNLAVFGLVSGAGLSLFIWLLICCMDSSVYLPKDIEKRFQIPVLGVLYKDGNEKEDAEDNREELLANAAYLLKGKKKIGVVYFGAATESAAAEKKTTAEKIEQYLADATQAETVSVFFEKGKMPDYNGLRQADAVVGCFCYKGADGKRAERYLADLEKQDCKIACAILYNADKKMYRRYYWQKKKNTVR